MPFVRLVNCAACGFRQADLGKRSTCSKCGVCPLPSFKYPVDSGFYPPPAKTNSVSKPVQRKTPLPTSPNFRGIKDD